MQRRLPQCSYPDHYAALMRLIFLGFAPLHVVARRWNPELAELLVARGADLTRRRADGRTPYAIAELHGNRAMADWLAKHGASAELSDVDRMVVRVQPR